MASQELKWFLKNQMTKQFICNAEKYEIGGPKGDVIGLPVSFTGLPLTIETEGLTLSLKNAFHVSLVCIGKIAEKNNLSDPDIVSKVILDFCEFTKHTPIELKEYSGEFRFVAENERRTLVAMCDILNLDTFFDFINKKYNLKAEYPPTHVTLYTLQPNAGIFLTNSDDIEKLTKLVKNPGIVLK